MRKKKVHFSADRLNFSCHITQALAHPLRLKILEFIDVHGRTHVQPIYKKLDLEQSVTSQHLKIMRLAGIVEAERKGREVYYTINYANIEKAEQAVSMFLGKSVL